MTPRDAALRAFTARCGWAGARLDPLAGDASNRRYLRLHRPDGTRAVLMDAPPDRGEDIRPFLRIAAHLRHAGLQAPAAIAADPDRGLLILQDLGDDLFARVLARAPAREEALYAAATDVLVHLHGLPLPAGIADYDPATMADLGALAADWYAPQAIARPALEHALRQALEAMPPLPATLALRDYHAENLVWLPGAEGINAVGLLDFQDAMRAPAGYDLVSLLTDARRNVDPRVATAMRARFAAATGIAPADLDTAFAALSAQRNLRILGVFARLCLRDGKPGYLPLLPRVWAHLQDSLSHPALADLKVAATALPAPDPNHVSALEAACGTRPSR